GVHAEPPRRIRCPKYRDPGDRTGVWWLAQRGHRGRVFAAGWSGRTAGGTGPRDRPRRTDSGALPLRAGKRRVQQCAREGARRLMESTSPEAGQAPPSSEPGSVRPEHLGWRTILVTGGAIFVVLAVVMFQSGNPNLYPTVVLVGSFLVPVVFVAYLFDHLHATNLSFEAVTWAFVLGGVLWIFGALILDAFLMPTL